MFHIVNLETRSLLTYPDEGLIGFGDAASAVSVARYAENITEKPHSILASDTDLFTFLSERREIAPWC